MTGPLLEVVGLNKSFYRGRGKQRTELHAVNDVSFSLAQGCTLGVVGESGSGKSTLGRLLLGLVPADSGVVRFEGTDLLSLRPNELRRRRSDFQMIFQDPYSSLDPSKTVGYSVGEPLRIFTGINGKGAASRVDELLQRVGLNAHYSQRYPAEMSGGQRQRVAIARALALSPKFIVADEAVSALDVSTQSEVINLLMRLQREQLLTYVFISHNLGVVRHVATDIAVMYQGKIVETGPAEQVIRFPEHPYTKTLLASVPNSDPRRRSERYRPTT